MIGFGEPRYRKELAFGLIVKIPVANVKRKGLRGLIVPNKVSFSCQVHGSFVVEAELVGEYTWGDDSIILLTELSPSYIDLAVKKQGYDWCGVTAVPMEGWQYLAPNSSTIVHLSIIGEERCWAEYVIENYGNNEDDLLVFCLGNEGG